LPTVTFDIAATADDGYAKRTTSDGLYSSVPTATLGAATGAAVEAASRNQITGPNYVVGNVLLRWDTSSIPDTATITSAQLKLFADDVFDADSLRLIADYYDFGGTADSSDWTYLIASPNAISEANGLQLNTVETTTDQTLTLDLENVTNISKTGYTGIRLGVNQRASDAAPTGVNRVNVAMYGTALSGGFAPQLLVTYTEGTTERLAPNTVVEHSGFNVTPTAGMLDDDPDSLEGDWATVADPSPVSGLTDGPRSPSANAAVSGFSGAFTNPANAYDGNTGTAATTTMGSNGQNHGSYFSFNTTAFAGIPSDATITGISLTARQGVSNNNRSDQFFQLGTANGTLIGNEVQQDATNVVTDDAVSGFTTMPTRAQLVSGTFGVRVRAVKSNTCTYSLYELSATVTYTSAGTTTNSNVRVGFPTPASALSAGAGLQEFRAAVRKVGSGSNPTARLELYETGDPSGTPIVSGTTDSITSSTPQVITATWNANLLGTTDGSLVEARVLGTGAAGGAVEVGAIEWNATEEAGASPQDVALTGVSSDESVGTLTTSVGATSRTLSGLTTEESTGTLTPSPGGVSRALSGLTTEESTGTLTFSGVATRALTGLTTEESTGTLVAQQEQLAELSGVASDESVGALTLSVGGLNVALCPTDAPGEDYPQEDYPDDCGITSDEMVGTLTYEFINLIPLNDLYSDEEVGELTAAAGSVTLTLVGVASDESTGDLTAEEGAQSRTLVGLSSEETVGALTLSAALALELTGVSSDEQAGSLEVEQGGGEQSVSLTGVSSDESVGIPLTLLGGVSVSLSGLTSEEAVGEIVAHSSDELGGVPTEEQVGTLTLAIGSVQLTLGSVIAPEPVGTFVMVGVVSRPLTGVPSDEIAGALFIGTEWSGTAASLYWLITPKPMVSTSISAGARAAVTTTGAARASASVSPGPRVYWTANEVSLVAP
jgi:hypothetical protein